MAMLVSRPQRDEAYHQVHGRLWSEGQLNEVPGRFPGSRRQKSGERNSIGLYTG